MKRSMRWLKVVVLALVLGSGVGADASACGPVPRPSSGIDARLLLPGNYTIRLVATRGSKAGHEAVGTLWLERTSRGDKSTLTGQRPLPDEDLAKIPLFGALTADLRAVGAPVASDDRNAPDPASTDPVRPGVLVHLVDWDRDYPRGTVVLTVGSLSNLRSEAGWLDGPGIGLWIHEVSERDFSGRWDRWGILSDGEGYFCMRRISP